MKPTNPTLRRVLRGVALLDKELGKKWVFRIKLSQLKLRDGCDCILGQLYGHYSASPFIKHSALSPKEAELHGLHVITAIDVMGTFEELTTTWLTVLRRLRKERKLPHRAGRK